MKIEKGKFYKSRNGQKWEVLTTDRKKDDYTVIAMDEDGFYHSFTLNGASFISSNYDLIAEWTEPVEIPWSDYPKWCKWVAMDKDGRWWGYIKKTEITDMESDCWVGDSDAFRIPKDYTPRNFTGDWTESLFERP